VDLSIYGADNPDFEPPSPHQAADKIARGPRPPERALPVESANDADDMTLLNLLRDGSAPLSLKDLLAAWPADHPRPEIHMLCRRLDRLADRGLVHRHGSGHRDDALRYEAAAAA